MHPIPLAVLSLIATSSLVIPKVLAQSESSAWEAISKMKMDPEGYFHIADDGVARSYDGNDAVIDYVPLANDQLMQLLSNLPEPWQQELDHLHSIFDGVDGLQVVDEDQLLNPPAWLRRVVDREPPQSQNPKREVESLLEGRDWYCPRPDDQDEETSQTRPSLKHSPSLQGFLHLASDGVYRSFSSSGEVVDYKQLNPAEIAIVLKDFDGHIDSEAFEKVKQKLQGVDGRNVTDLDQLLHPGPELRPLKFNK
ncbi:hypothetical protein BDV38DRAFT_281542 [Aspergillus pseudotamarii]|uniref:Uncharacterized protein n=1 Tax=Aspergillus pseudotamarii TaxID=132259 RepID=A0A5N6SYY6_ASPPS|nr:uncharacterized protein BDV38DRAFT_281542 [Aspergillus pseudotamarii]KAE8138981.1 hypothetical protein BDV38DRAFT_281542 [Aspergillus pseudotamarii]